jgi:hypothetical protein
MDLLFRLKKGIENFADKDETKHFFREILPNRDSHCFFDVNRKRQIKANDTIYFTYDGFVVATATFLGDIIEDFERDKKYVFGHRVKDIKIVVTEKKINTKIFGTRSTYINSDKKRNELKRVLS